MKRPDYQNLNDDLDEITDRRNAEVRAWGRKVLADADALLLTGQVRDGGDWDLIQEDDEDEIVIVPAQEEPEEPVEATLPPELEAQINQQIADTESGKTTPKPRTKPKPATTS